MIHRTSQSASAVIGQASAENASPLKMIGVGLLTGYFEFLDEIRESGATNMYGAGAYLKRKYPSMDQFEARKVGAQAVAACTQGVDLGGQGAVAAAIGDQGREQFHLGFDFQGT